MRKRTSSQAGDPSSSHQLHLTAPPRSHVATDTANGHNGLRAQAKTLAAGARGPWGSLRRYRNEPSLRRQGVLSWAPRHRCERRQYPWGASLIFWSLTMVVSIKYVAFILRADNKGEGGIYALLALIPTDRRTSATRLHSAVVIAAIFGAALLYGDGVITPAISVLSAIEGLEVATEAAAPFVLPLTCIVLLLLFLVQRRGTAGIGKVFGPIVLVWFAAIATLGVLEIMAQPSHSDGLKPNARL